MTGSLGTFLILILGSSCDAASGTAATRATVQYLDLEHPSIRRSLSATAGSLKRARFVEVDVSAVSNPKRYGLTFEVFFERDGAAPVRLGTFSLYPADNPGKFIVPASGKLTAPGSLIVSMIITDLVDPSAPSPKVAVGKISLVE